MDKGEWLVLMKVPAKGYEPDIEDIPIYSTEKWYLRVIPFAYYNDAKEVIELRRKQFPERVITDPIKWEVLVKLIMNKDLITQALQLANDRL